MTIQFIRDREGDMVDFDLNRIKIAITKAYEATGISDVSDIPAIVDAIYLHLEEHEKTLAESDLLHVDHIQDIVEKNLMQAGKYNVAKEYILYRKKHDDIRQEAHEEELKKLETHQLHVTKNNGNKEEFSRDKIHTTYKQIAKEFAEVCPFSELQEELKKYLIDNIKTTDITNLIIKAAINLISLQ
ncbi:TPA: hypothetical protein DEP21_00845, partial [Patescibacteria group bacterium]|nr:hypothetical protein [Candidatus Gracilibacteria bacterium]